MVIEIALNLKIDKKQTKQLINFKNEKWIKNIYSIGAQKMY
jgi:hypothetical protein